MSIECMKDVGNFQLVETFLMMLEVTWLAIVGRKIRVQVFLKIIFLKSICINCIFSQFTVLM